MSAWRTVLLSNEAGRTVSARPRLDDVNVVRSRAVHGSNTYGCSASLPVDRTWRNGWYRPLYVVPKSTPTTSLSLAVVLLSGTLLGPMVALVPGLNVVGILLPLLGNVLFIVCVRLF